MVRSASPDRRTIPWLVQTMSFTPTRSRKPELLSFGISSAIRRQLPLSSPNSTAPCVKSATLPRLGLSICTALENFSFGDFPTPSSTASRRWPFKSSPWPTDIVAPVIGEVEGFKTTKFIAMDCAVAVFPNSTSSVFSANASPCSAYYPIRLHQRPLRDRQAYLLGGLQVDHEIEFDRLFDRQIGWFCSL